MDWEETVMSQTETTKYIDKWLNGDVEARHVTALIAEAQAEISFKAGRDSFLDDVGNATIPLSEVYEKGHKAGFNEALNTVVATRQYDEGKQAGMRKVVEWINNNVIGDENGYVFNDEPLILNHKQWRARLKEWGIK